MSLPPAKYFAWPFRVGVASCLTSLLTLVRDDDFNQAVSSVVFGVVVTIVAASDTLGATLATSWAIVGGATIGCVLSALCVALFGSHVSAVLVANFLVGVAVLYPEKFPVVSQKFAFGGSTIFAWTAFAGADMRWMTLGIPLSTAIGACSAIIVTAFGGCDADDAVAAAADACAAAVADAVASAVAAFATTDVSAREALRARVEREREDAERSLARMRGAAAHAVWERKLRAVFAGRLRRAAPEASAGTFAEVTLHVRGMTLALDALAETQVQRWHLLNEDPRDAGEASDAARTATFAEATFAEQLEETASRVADAARAAAGGFRPKARAEAVAGLEGREPGGGDDPTDGTDTANAVLAKRLRASLARLDVALTRQRRKHYAPGGRASDAGESVARRALQANHLWMFNFQSLARELARFLDPERDGESGAADGARGRPDGEVPCEACGDLEARRDGAPGKPTRFPREPASARADTVGALLRCDFRLDADQLAYAVKLSFAAATAGSIGWATSGSGLWAAVTVAMVGTREGRAVGGSFNAALLRMQGTVIGAMFSFALVVLVTGGDEGVVAAGASVGRLLLLASFAALSAFLRLNPEYAYAGVVAAFTAYVVALGIPDDADVAAARAFAHGRVEQNLLGLLVLVAVEFAVFPVFAHDAARVAAGHTVLAAKGAAETVYDATVGTDCALCRARAAEDAAFSLTAVCASLATQKALLMQAAAEPHLWSSAFPLRAHQQMVTDLENTRRVLGLMRKALGAMARDAAAAVDAADAAADAAPPPGADLGADGSVSDPRARIASLLAPTDAHVIELRRAVKVRLSRAADDLVSGSGRLSSRGASASVARAQSRLERAFILHTLAMRERFRAGETEMFLPNALMVPWHAYVACTGILAATVTSLGAASWDALLAVAEMDEDDGEGESRSPGSSRSDAASSPAPRRASFGTGGTGSARAKAVRAMRAKRDAVESDAPPFVARLREVRVEDEAVGTRP